MRSVSVSLSDELCRSYVDLTRHFDPAGAAVGGAPGTAGRLGHFDSESVREHTAAFRAIEAGIEELAVEDAADELDRTALLDDVRVTLFRIKEEQPHRRNPAFWMRHLCDALWAASRAEDRQAAAAACLREVPRFLQAAAATLSEPPAAFIDTAVALAGPAADQMGGLIRLLGGPDAPPDTVRAAADAEAALARFRLTLDSDLSAHADEHAFAAGERHFDRLLHHQHATTAGAPELWRHILRLEEQVEAGLRDLAREVRDDADWRAVLEARAMPLERAPLEVEGLRRHAARIGLPIAAEAPEFGTLPSHLALLEPLGRYIGGEARPGVVLLADGRAARAALPALSAELGGPGQHALASRAAGLRSEIRRRLAWNGVPAWGLYALKRLDDGTTWSDPPDRIVIRAHVLFRILLARLDISLHTLQASVAEAVVTLTERLPIPPTEALAAVRGVLMEPTRAAGAVAGCRELERLFTDRQREMGSAFSAARHHDDVLGFGGLPASLIRWGLGLED